MGSTEEPSSSSPDLQTWQKNNVFSKYKRSQFTNYFIKNGTCLERVEASGHDAVILRRNTGIVLRRYSLEFEIINALYVTFTPNTPEDYLCLVGESRINFYALADDQLCSLALPFKICSAHQCSFGLLLERDCFSELRVNLLESAQLFSLTHPYNEMFPVLCKFQEDEHCHYAFRHRRICIMPKDSDRDATDETIKGYDLEKKIISVFRVRECSKEERNAAKTDLCAGPNGGIFNSTMNTPMSMQSFYSPNFFNRRFAEQQHVSMVGTGFSPVSGTGHSSSLGRSPFFANQSPNVISGSTVTRVTPLRRSLRIRSMAAAAHSENLALASSLSNTGSLISTIDKPSALRKSLGMNLLQQATLNYVRQRGLSGTPTRLPFNAEHFLSFGQNDGTSLNCAVEYCLEWVCDISPTEEPEEEPSKKKNRTRLSIVRMAMDSPIQSTSMVRRRLDALDDFLDQRLKKQANCLLASKLKEFPTADEQQAWTSLRWSVDIRLHNISQMLDSSKPILIPNVKSGIAHNDEREQQEQFLVLTALKTITRPFGQSLLNFRTEKPVPNDPWVVRPICLNGRVSPGRMQIDYPVAETNAAHRSTMEWASFYNGVAHGLAIMGFEGFSATSHPHYRGSAANTTVKPIKKSTPKRADISSGTTMTEWNIFYGWDPNVATANQCHSHSSSNVVFDWDWLCMNLKAHQDQPPLQAGFLFASGLTGHIRSISLYDIHAFLTKSDKFLVIALLLGSSIAHKGSSDVHIYKVLATHLPFLLMPTLCEFRIEASIQTTALVSLGFLFAETVNLSLTNQLINQMSREIFDTDQSSERYGYVLSAGFAIGLINLGKGKEIADTEIPIAYPHLSPKDRLIKLLKGGERHLCLVHHDQVQCSTKGGIPSNDATRPGLNSNHVKESKNVNIHLTSPAACVALGLMYLRTNDKWVSNALTIPNTLCEIEKIRPDVLMMRTLSKCLINYEHIGSNMEWVEQQVPEIIRKYTRHFMSSKSPWWSSFIDMNCVAQAYFYCCAGACFAMALRYASTCDSNAQRTIQCFYERVQMENSIGNIYARLSTKSGKNCVNASINVCAVSLAMVMAGSGDLYSTQVLRKIRNLKRPYASKDSALHSLHVASNMALGLLYLGHGRLSLAKSNIAIASLVISFFPIFPHSITDNRIFFQPLRFLWTLAIETRFLVTVDAQSLAAVTVDICVSFKDDKKPPLMSKTPLILPPLYQINAISLVKPVEELVHDETENSEVVYNHVKLNLLSAQGKDTKKLREILHKYHGRFPLTRRKTEKGKSEFVRSTTLLKQTMDVLAELEIPKAIEISL
uniref:Anaphase-promoting complex subunit 1 n=1 Tax=Ditylenchus dipsaci TaxID=166011 RepID=A0A915D2V7_9BILA